MSMSELINSAFEDENNGTDESETSDDEYLSDFTKLQPYLYEPSGKQSSDSQEDISKTGNTIWCSCGKYKPMATHVENICCLNK